MCVCVCWGGGGGGEGGEGGAKGGAQSSRPLTQNFIFMGKFG